jgi:hypothetical protein
LFHNLSHLDGEPIRMAIGRIIPDFIVNRQPVVRNISRAHKNIMIMVQQS